MNGIAGENSLPKRKHPRLDEYDYSASGSYFITICTQDRQRLLSHIAVGRGLAPAEMVDVQYTLFGAIAEQQLLLLEDRYRHLTIDRYVIMPDHIHVIMILHDDEAEYMTDVNNTAQCRAGACSRRDDEGANNVAQCRAGACPRPTIMDIICAYKSLTTRECKKNGFAGRLFQTSFYEHIIRRQEDYDEIAQYISENLMRWYYNHLNTSE